MRESKVHCCTHQTKKTSKGLEFSVGRVKEQKEEKRGESGMYRFDSWDSVEDWDIGERGPFQ